VTNVASKSFGLVAFADESRTTRKIFNLITAGMELPKTTTSTDFCTAFDSQINLEGEVRENTSTEETVALDDGRLIGKVQVQFASPWPRETPIHVTFTLNREGRLLVHAKEPRSGREAQVEIQTESRTAPEELVRQRQADDKKSVS